MPQKRPCRLPAVSLEKLPQMLKSLGLTDYRDGADFLENSYITYELDPVKDPDADWRLDVYTGSNRLPVLINEYMSAQSDMMNEYHKDGIVAGFLCYPLNGFESGNRAEQILQFRDTLQDAIQNMQGGRSHLLGGATGLYYGYLDFIAWDLLAVLDAARAFFADTDLTWSGFHVFRRDVGAVRLWEQEKSRRLTRRQVPFSPCRILRHWNPFRMRYQDILDRCFAGWRILSSRVCRRENLLSVRPIRISRSLCGIPLPATIWMSTGITARRQTG